MKRIKVDLEIIKDLIPEASTISILPRKRKKALKRKVSNKLLDLAIEHANSIINKATLKT
jgi:hypothetical protein